MGEVGGARHPDLCIGLCHVPLIGCDIGTPFEQIRRQPRRNVRRFDTSDLRCQRETRRRLADQDGNRMLILGPGNPEIVACA